MDCPNCGTWNPDDKMRCWRCSTEMPKPPEPKKRRRPTSQTWVWVVAVLIFIVSTLIQCGVIPIGDGGDSAGFVETLEQYARLVSIF